MALHKSVYYGCRLHNGHNEEFSAHAQLDAECDTFLDVQPSLVPGVVTGKHIFPKEFPNQEIPNWEIQTLSSMIYGVIHGTTHGTTQDAMHAANYCMLRSCHWKTYFTQGIS